MCQYTPQLADIFSITIVCHTIGKIANSPKRFAHGVSLRNRMVPYTSEASFHEYLKGGLGLPNKALWITCQLDLLPLLYEAC